MRGLFQSVKGAVVRAGVAVGVGVAAVAAPVVARAQTSTGSSVDYTSLTSQIDFSSTVTAVLAVAGSLVLLYVAIKGAKTVLRMIRSA